MAAALAFALALAFGCVGLEAHRDVAAERDRLALEKSRAEEEVRLLRIANESLDAEVARLVDSREDLLVSKTQLEGALDETQTSAAALSTRLQRRERELEQTVAALHAEAAKVGELQSTYEGLVSDLEAEVTSGQIRIEQLAEGISLDVSQDILFSSGSASLNAEGREVLQRVAARIGELPYEVVVGGHSDDVPVSKRLASRYPSNWELAGARASSVVRLLLDAGIPGERLTAASHGPFRPVAENDSADGRSLNRRIELRLRPLPQADAEALAEQARGGLRGPAAAAGGAGSP